MTNWGKMLIWSTAILAAAAVVAAMAAIYPGRLPDSAANDAAGVGSEPVLSWTAILYTDAPPDDTVLREIERRTNTRLAITWVPDNVKEEKIDIALATNRLTDIFTVQNLRSTAFLKAVRAGSFWEIGPYLQDYPNLSRMSPDILRNIAIDGKIYGIYRERDLSRQGVIYREDWLVALGLAAPSTTGELYEVMRAFTEDDPDGNGKRDTYGLADRNDLKYGAFKTLSSYFNTPNEWGERNGKLLPEFMFDGYLETMRFMRSLYENGLMNAEFAITSKQRQWAEFTEGRAGIYIGNLDDARNLYAAAAKLNPGVKVNMTNRIAGPDGRHHVWSHAGHNGMFVFPKSAVRTEPELKEILAFFDRLSEPDMYNLLNYGIEGVHYRVVDGQYVEFLEGASELKEREVRPLVSLMGMGKPSLKPYGDPLKARSDALNEDNLSIAVRNPAAALESETLSNQGEELRSLIEEATYLFILGKLDEDGFREAVDRWRSAGGDRAIREINEAHAAARGYETNGFGLFH